MHNKLVLLLSLTIGWFLPGAVAAERVHGLSSAQDPARAIVNGAGLLWKVERPGAPPSYVFGTIHSEDKRVVTLPGPVQAAFDQARSFTMEMVLEPEAGTALAAAMLLDDGRTLQGILGDELFERAAGALEKNGMSRQIAMGLKPWVVMVMLSMPKPDTGEFLDKVLYTAALKQDKPVHGLESVEEQVAAFEGLPLDDQITLLKAAIDEPPSTMIEDATRAYLARDLAAMMALNDRFGLQLEPRLFEKITHRLLDSRNVRMVRRMEPRLEEGNTFIAIGALHLPGEKGVLRLLEGRGYRVTAVY